MNGSMTSTMSAAVLATACGLAMAQDKPAPAPAKADNTQVIPARKDIKPNPPTIEKMDDNAQRSHDRNSAVTPQGGDPNATSGNRGGSPARAVGGVRDWAAIDKNKDHLISPDEMEAALKESRSSTGSAPARK